MMPFRLDPNSGYRWQALADYNAEKRRGVAHTPEYEAAMVEEQAKFDQDQRDRYRCAACGETTEYEGGGFLFTVLRTDQPISGQSVYHLEHAPPPEPIPWWTKIVLLMLLVAFVAGASSLTYWLLT